MQKISHLFNFTDAKKITTPFSINNIINTKSQLDIDVKKVQLIYMINYKTNRTQLKNC